MLSIEYRFDFNVPLCEYVVRVPKINTEKSSCNIIFMISALHRTDLVSVD